MFLFFRAFPRHRIKQSITDVYRSITVFSSDLGVYVTRQEKEQSRMTPLEKRTNPHQSLRKLLFSFWWGLASLGKGSPTLYVYHFHPSPVDESSLFLGWITEDIDGLILSSTLQSLSPTLLSISSVSGGGWCLCLSHNQIIWWWKGEMVIDWMEWWSLGHTIFGSVYHVLWFCTPCSDWSLSLVLLVISPGLAPYVQFLVIISGCVYHLLWFCALRLTPGHYLWLCLTNTSSGFAPLA